MGDFVHRADIARGERCFALQVFGKGLGDTQATYEEKRLYTVAILTVLIIGVVSMGMLLVAGTRCLKVVMSRGGRDAAPSLHRVSMAPVALAPAPAPAPALPLGPTPAPLAPPAASPPPRPQPTLTRGAACHASMTGTAHEHFAFHAVEHSIDALAPELGRVGVGWSADVPACIDVCDVVSPVGCVDVGELLCVLRCVLGVELWVSSQLTVRDALRGCVMWPA